MVWLHDVVEDTRWDLISLARAGLDLAEDEDRGWWLAVASEVDRLSHRTNEPRADYYARVRESARAVRVKLADIADNTDPERMAKLPPEKRPWLEEKYRKALRALG